MTGPAGEKWEVYTVLADSETFGNSPSTSKTTAPGRVACAAAGTLPTPQRRKSATPAADHTTSDTGVGGDKASADPVRRSPNVRLRP